MMSLPLSARTALTALVLIGCRDIHAPDDSSAYRLEITPPGRAIALKEQLTLQVTAYSYSGFPLQLPPLCANSRLSAGFHELLSGTSFPLAALYTYAHIDVLENYGVALLTYRTEEGREIHTVVRGAIDLSLRDSGYVTHFPWQPCTS